MSPAGHSGVVYPDAGGVDSLQEDVLWLDESRPRPTEASTLEQWPAPPPRPPARCAARRQQSLRARSSTRSLRRILSPSIGLTSHAHASTERTSQSIGSSIGMRWCTSSHGSGTAASVAIIV